MITAAEIEAIAGPDGMRSRAYTDPKLFELEQERIFARAWLFVGHESQLPDAGDFRRTRLGRHDVIVVRGEDGTANVLFNACSHRGTRLCASAQGKAQRFVCPYHAWAFGLDGELVAVPGFDSYPDDVRPGAKHLRLGRAPRVDSYRGFVFASLAAEGVPLREFLGPMCEAIDNLVERAPDGTLRVAGGHFKVRYRGNWKLHHENANDTVHPGFVHRSSVQSARAARDPSRHVDKGQTVNMMAANGFTPREWAGIELHGFEQGHSYMAGFYESGILARRAEDAVAVEYREALAAARGSAQADAILGMDRFNNLVWPNLNVNAQFHQLRVVQPVSVNETIIEGYCFRLGGAPEEIFHRAVRFLGTLVSPASMIFSDDLEIFERVQRGLETGQIDRLNARRGSNTDVSAGHGELRSTTASELPLRAQAQAWRDWMSQDAGA